MTSIDDLFKKPHLPSKRKLEISHDPSHFYKSAKHGVNGDVKSSAYATTIENVSENLDDIEAGPAPPPDEDEEGEEDTVDYSPEDDEDGRFFGSGIDQGARQALDFVDARDSQDVYKEAKYDLAWLRKFTLAFEKRISKNAELRAKYEDDPTKFMASEADLDDSIKQLSILSSHPRLYIEFAKLGCVASLVSLLTHENTDIAIDAIEILNELLDDDVEAAEEQWTALVEASIESELPYLLVNNFQRLDEAEEIDRTAIYNSLSILESLASQSHLAEKIGKDTTLLRWLLKRTQVAETPLTQNKQYAAELLSILVQSSSTNSQTLIELDAVDMILQLLAFYRMNDPTDSLETEYAENLFDTVTRLLDEPQGKQKFEDAEGVELALIMMRQGKMSKIRAARMLDHAVSTSKGVSVSSRIVEAQGLKTLFGVFMKKYDAAMTEHFLGIFAALLRNLPAGSPERLRTLAKFVEKDYEKITKLMVIRRATAPRLLAVDRQIAAERNSLDAQQQEMSESEWLSKRFDAGLYSLQTLDIILAWLAAEDDGAMTRIAELLKARDETLDTIRETLEDQLMGIEDADTEAVTTKEMLQVLINILR